MDATDQPTATAGRPLLQRLWDLPVHAAWLDPVAVRAADVVHAVEPRWLADLLHGSWLGHPLHPLLAQGTVGLWSSAAVLDALRSAGLVPSGRQDGVDAASTVLVAAGTAAALPTIAAGWTDYSDLHREQQRIGLVHSSANYTAGALFAASLVARLRGRHGRGRVLGLLGFGVSGLGAALGTHLSYRWAAGANHAEGVPHRVPSGWYRVALVDDLVESTPRRSEIGDVPVVVVRRGDDVRVLADTCSHLAGPLSQGSVSVERGEACITCPWHGSTFRLSDGGVVHGPATASQPTFQVRVDGRRQVLARLRPVRGVPVPPPAATVVAD
ncbi:Rieske (2Fe-2S) protein [Quadrisphaera sp. DSM 44207]|uniref:Rieske 2Fe-2S domain-containing protein n=1 Tax=Quadrisphaera sp. DSM 44207 TaxID=1881057 RepID=UPI00087F05D3|nr:Rieske (2Fe-2S) protein [Quadrisphaera sp. DSM 44207]SDQ71937.1 Ferredoxin subunit of nitrite reductase or a ring-hydroxylating dioxygenase [Quadrisphaera sp. DSM 44207]